MTAGTRLLALLAYVAICTVWGSTFLAIRLAIDSLPPFLMSSVRFVSAGAILCLFSYRKGRSLSAQEWKHAMLSGALLFLGGNGAVVWAEQSIASGLTALIVSTIPLWIVLIQWSRGQKPSALLLLGVITGLFGMMVLVGPQQLTGSKPVDIYVSAVLMLGAFSWAAGSLYTRTKTKNFTLASAGAQMLTGGIWLAFAALLHGEFAVVQPGNVSAISFMSLVYLIVAGSLVAYSFYLWLLKTISPAAVATYAFFNPIVAIVLGVFILNEPISTRMIGASVLILMGVAITVFSSVGRSNVKQDEASKAVPALTVTRAQT